LNRKRNAYEADSDAMKVYKDLEHSVALSPFSHRGKRYLTVCVGLYASFDVETGHSRLRTEQDFWKEVPELFAALGKPPVLDTGLPKPGAEVLVAGFCRTPGAKPLPAQGVAFRVGNVSRRITVFGDRLRLPGGGFTDPLPFAALPLVWENAFGGPDFPANPAGKGLGKNNKVSQQVPNLEDPAHFVLSDDDMPHPVCPFPMHVDHPERRALSGTYDTQWRETRWPAYPDDLDPNFFYAAQTAQRLAPPPGAADADTLFFRGDEDLEITGMSHEYPHIRSRLPDVRIRAFVTTTENFTPFASSSRSAQDARHPLTSSSGSAQDARHPLPYVKDLDQPGIFREVTLHADTVWLLPDLMGVFVLRRGLLPVVDDEMDDVLRVYVVAEKSSEAPKSPAYWLEEQKKRIRPAVEIDLAPFVAAQAATSKAVKTARDLPKMLDKIKKDFLGQSPVMPLNLGDMAHSSRKTLTTARATLDTLEKQVLTQRRQFSHLVSFDTGIFTRMRAGLDEQEKNLDAVLKRAQASLDEANRQAGQALGAMRARLNARLSTPGKTPSPQDAQTLRATLAELDAFSSPEAILTRPRPLNPRHDRGFPLLIEARRALRRDDVLLARLAALGFDEKTLEDAWIGHAAEAREEKPEDWGLPPGPAFTIPAGLCVPRFAGRELVALRVYPMNDRSASDADLLRGLGADAASIVLVPGSDAAPLSLPASYPDEAVCVAPEDLSALFTEQEAGDFCRIVVAPDPAALAAVAGLPPPAPAEDGPPLVVILPPEAQGKALFASWAAAFPAAVPLYLPEDCPHVLTLAGLGKRLRPLLLELLPPDIARRQNFDIPLPPKDGPPRPFTQNLPLPSKEEIQGRIDTLITEVRAHFPDPQKEIARETAKALDSMHKQALAALQRMKAPQEAFAEANAAFAEAARPKAPPAGPVSVAEMTEQALAAVANMKTKIPAGVPAEAREKFLAELDQAALKVRGLGEQLAPLDKLREEGTAKLEALGKGELPEDIKAAFAAAGMDPDALKELTREDVRDMLAAGRSLTRKNLRGLDLTGLDFSGADLSHAVCTGTKFSDCAMRGTNFTFTIANEADFSGADLSGARLMQAVLQKAVLRKANCTATRMELTAFGECAAAGAIFDKAEIELCTFDKADLAGARFSEATLSLCAFGETRAAGADFRKTRAFKCLFRQTEFGGARFEDAVLPECLFQGASCAGLSFAGADLRKLHADVDADFSGADFYGADLREASLRMSRFVEADFYGACLEDAFFTQCDLSGARLDGLRATGCRFIKCDLSGADLSGTDLRNGALRKCRLTGADLSGAGLFAANLQNMVIGKTDFKGANLKYTVLEGAEEALRREAQR
jgi:uncharacterized protein YjbI with pentapeptide repeats